jgi:small-conductance mechanosensitive channel
MFGWQPWPTFAAAVGAALVAAIVVAAVLAIPVRLVARRAGWDPKLIGKIRRPFRVLLLVVGLWIAVAATYPDAVWRLQLEHGLIIATIAASAWLVGGLLDFAFARTLARYPTDVVDNRVARRVHTQIAVLRRVVIVVIVVLALGAILLTFPGVEAVGTSVLASAGVVSVIAGLAAQSTLGNVFAGIQLAFSDAIRVDDVVVVAGQWGRIEDITLTYVVVHVWDDRRLVLPSTYFTSTPFENWTRRSSQLLGSVEFDLDWRVSPGAMRTQLEAILDSSELWDGRSRVLQVTDAVGGRVHVRVLVSAKDAPTLFDLRCTVRERLVDWLQQEQPQALPVDRVELRESAAPASPKRSKAHEPAAAGEPEGLFSGSPEAEERAQTFTGTTPIAKPSDADIAEGHAN